MKTSNENDALLSTNDNNAAVAPKKKCFSKVNKIWLVVIALVFALFTMAAVFENKIGEILGVKYHVERRRRSNDGLDETWKQIEDIDLKWVPSAWKWKEDVPDTHTIPLTFAIKQSNTHLIDEKLLEVSHPDSHKYGQHWTYSQVHDFLKPSQKSTDVILGWLADWGIPADNIEKLTPNGDFIRVNIDIETAEKMLNTDFGYWQHSETGTKHIRVRDDYFVPSDVASHLDFVSPTLRFPIVSHTHTMKLVDAQTSADITTEATNYVTPPTLKRLYAIDDYKGGFSKRTIQVVASFLQEWFDDSDLSQFWNFFDIEPSEVIRVPEYQPDGYGSEAELDVQYITSTGEKIRTIVWDIEDDLYFITLLQQIADSNIPPSVVSMSYGGDEQSNGWGYCNRANNEFAKVGLLGISFFASSGDDGAISETMQCANGEYTPSFPASSPYVTAVGGTYDGNFESLDKSTNELGWYYSGGGFSIFFDRKPFQDQAVNDYLSSVSSLPPASRYNRNGAAYPDLSAQAVDFVICYNELYYAVSGTSASCPTVAGMVALINDRRLAAGKTKLGWLNPVLYGLYNQGSQEYFFNDVVTGFNMGCDADGIAFYNTQGWDPVTGLGTMKFQRLLEELYTYGTPKPYDKNVNQDINSNLEN